MYIGSKANGYRQLEQAVRVNKEGRKPYRTPLALVLRDRQRQTDRQTEIEGQRDRQKDRQIQRDRQTERQTESERPRARTGRIMPEVKA